MEPRLRYQVIYVSVKNKLWTYDSPLADSIIVQKYHLLINVFLQHCYHSGIWDFNRKTSSVMNNESLSLSWKLLFGYIN